ncbi:hypothetical protein [Austwickia chelonae]|uniref:hypothetical protein n=1 Tax=Austwickia chelonae TaxID=100225 RepID=UPI000E25AFC6|nr:hypothetical protein [Austwickia chelonae]
MAGRSRVFTSEPMATRALGAEFRHDPTAALRLLEKEMKLDEGSLAGDVEVSCEATDRIDVELRIVRSDVSAVTVGIEAKFDHAIAAHQTGESGRFDRYVLVVLDRDDASDVQDRVSAVVTWRELLATFDGSRLTLNDVNAMPAGKVQVERRFREALARRAWPDDWSVEVKRGSRGIPAVRIEGPKLPDGRTLRGQVQVHDRVVPADIDDVTLDFHVGVAVFDNDDDLPQVSAGIKPAWVDYLSSLYTDVLRQRPEDHDLSQHSAKNGNSERGKNKMPLVREYLPDTPWLAQGYVDWAFGVKSRPTRLAGVDRLMRDAQRLFLEWHEVSVARLAAHG